MTVRTFSAGRQLGILVELGIAAKFNGTPGDIRFRGIVR
jgi:hypothetical protein